MTRDGRRRPARGPVAAASLALATAVVAALVAAQGPVPALSSDAPSGALATADRPAVTDPAGRTSDRTSAPTSGQSPGQAPDAAPAPGTAEIVAGPAGADAAGASPAGDPGVPAPPAAPVVQVAAGPGSAPVPPAAPTAPAGPADPAGPAEGVVTGTLTRVWVDSAPHGEDHGDDHGDAHGDAHGATGLLAFVETADGALPLVAADVAAVEDGSSVTLALGAPRPDRTRPARVLQVQEPVAAAGELLYGEGSPDVFGVAAASVVHEVTVALAVPRGATADSTTPTAVASAVDGGVNTYWSQQTRGQRGFRVVAAHGWQTLSSTCSDAWGLWDEVASRVGFVAGPRRHLLVVLPGSAGCGAGLGTVGSPDAGGRSYVSGANASVIAHELGHNMGLGHSNGLLCSSSSDGLFASGAWQPGCTVHAYRDYYDVMGISWSNLGSLAAPQAEALGVLRSTEKLTVSAPARVRLVPASTDGLRALRIDDPGGTYWVEYRTASGWDGWLGSNYRGLDAGVLVHRPSPSTSREVLLLDGTVTAGTRTDDWRSALPAGGSFTTASGATRVVVESADATGATLVVFRDGVGPSPVVPPAGGAQVDVRTPAAGVRAGSVTFAGVASAPEGTLLWEVTQDGAQKASGWAPTGVNGAFDTFTVPVSLPVGTYTFRAWVPDEGDEGPGGALLEDSVTVSVS